MRARAIGLLLCAALATAAGPPSVDAAVAADPSRVGIAYVGRVEGIFETVTGGAIWAKADAGIAFRPRGQRGVHSADTSPLRAGRVAYRGNEKGLFPGPS